MKVIILSMFEDSEHIDQALQRGADGYVVKSINPLDLPSTIRQVVEGAVHLRGVATVAGPGEGTGGRRRTSPERRRRPHRPGADHPATRRGGPLQPRYRQPPVRDRADGQVPPVQHLPQARGRQPHRGDPLRLPREAHRVGRTRSARVSSSRDERDSHRHRRPTGGRDWRRWRAFPKSAAHGSAAVPSRLRSLSGPPPTSSGWRRIGLTWLNIESPAAVDAQWLAANYDFHELDIEDVLSRRQQRSKIDEYSDYLFIVLHFPRYDKRTERLQAAELDIFVAEDLLITLPKDPLKPLSAMWSQCESRGGGARPPHEQGIGLPGLRDRRPDLRLLLPDPQQDRPQARVDRGPDLRGQERRGRAGHLQRQAGDHQLPQDHQAAAADAPRSRAHDPAVRAAGPRDLLRRHRRQERADLGRARELQGGRRGARGDQRVGHPQPPERPHPGPDDALGDPAAAHARDRLLRHEHPAAVPGPLVGGTSSCSA